MKSLLEADGIRNGSERQPQGERKDVGQGHLFCFSEAPQLKGNGGGPESPSAQLTATTLPHFLSCGFLHLVLMVFPHPCLHL